MTKPLYFYNGTTFEQVGPTTPQSPIAYQTSAPTGPATGDLWIDSDGDVDTYNRQLTRYYFVATAAQTTITGVDANSLTLAYVAGSEAVYVNGALQVRGQDYTATNGTSVVMSSGLAVNDVVEIFAYTAFTVANAYTKTETDGIAAAAAGLRMVVPTSISVGSGTGSVDATGNVTFSGASSVSVNGCFTSVYDNYLVLVSFTGTGSSVNMSIRLRASGTDATGASTYNFQYIDGSNTSITGARDSGTYHLIGTSSSTASMLQSIRINLYDAFKASPTAIQAESQSNISSGYLRFAGGSHTVSTSYDGFTVYPGSGNLTGIIRVYGYKD